MENEKQIIIDGVNVSECQDFYISSADTKCCNCESDNTQFLACKNNPNCYYKQLAHKTQEYEDLKFCTESLSFKYKKCYSILEEIEKVCLDDTYTFADGTQIRYDSLDDILNIINKAKGGK